MTASCRRASSRGRLHWLGARLAACWPPHQRGPLIACVGAFAVLALYDGLVPPDSDTPWHLAYGRLLIDRWADESFGIHVEDVFSWTARGSPWHPNAWLFDAVLAGSYETGRWVGVAALRLALLAGIVVLAWRRTARSDAGGWARAGAVWVAMPFVIPWSAARPQLTSFVLLLAALEMTASVLDAEEDARSAAASTRTWKANPVLLRLAALAITVSFWALLHGAVVAGVVAIVAACAGDVLDRRKWGRAVLTAVVVLLASLATPSGISTWTHAFLTSRDSAQEMIMEWQRPSLERPEDVVFTLLLMALLVAGLSLPGPSGARFSWRLLGPGLLLALLALQAVRNRPMAAQRACTSRVDTSGPSWARLGRHYGGRPCRRDASSADEPT